MENQSKVIVIERNKFAALVKSHRKCLQMLNILTYIYTVKEVSLTLTLQEICEVLHMTPEEVEIQRQKGYIRFTTQKGMTVYEIEHYCLSLHVIISTIKANRGIKARITIPVKTYRTITWCNGIRIKLLSLGVICPR